MNVQSLSKPPVEVTADWLAIGVFEGQTASPPSLQETPLGDLIEGLLTGKELSSDLGATQSLHGVAGIKATSVLVFGLGSKEKFGAGAAFSAGTAISKKLATKKRGTVAVVLPVGTLAIASAAFCTYSL